jgi:SpoVK/Ycf46/Vps4 family AAA+-type ATPase
MPRTDDLARLFSAVAQGDLVKARSLADKIADREEAAGKPGAAASLRKALVTRTGPREETAVETVHRVAPDLLTQLSPARLRGVTLTKQLRSTLNAIVREHRHRDRLREHGLEPRSVLFFHGPPGCGKTITTRALAEELGVPAYVVRFDALLGAYLGQTSARVHEVFRFASQHECVLLVDEIDAVGRRRGGASDIAEVDRVVITVMQQLDLVRPAGLLVAASNMPEHLDPALVRRFDAVLEFPMPERRALKAFADSFGRARGVSVLNGIAQDLAGATTFADVERIIVSEQRRILLDEG